MAAAKEQQQQQQQQGGSSVSSGSPAAAGSADAAASGGSSHQPFAAPLRATGAFTGTASQSRPIPLHVLEQEYEMVHQVTYADSNSFAARCSSRFSAMCTSNSIHAEVEHFACVSSVLYHGQLVYTHASTRYCRQRTHKAAVASWKQEQCAQLSCKLANQRTIMHTTVVSCLALQAFATDSGDQSPWIYYRWLLGNSLAHLSQAQRQQQQHQNGEQQLEEARVVLGEVRRVGRRDSRLKRSNIRRT
jgi:hypothetical protein